MTGRGPSFPIAATIAGVEVVTIPLTDYVLLRDCQRRAAEWGQAVSL